MKKLGNKIYFILVIIVILILILAFGVKKGSNTKTEKKSDNKITREGLMKDEMYNNLKFINGTITKKGKDGLYTFSIDVNNETESSISQEVVGITLKDKDGKPIVTLRGYIGSDPMLPRESRKITVKTDKDITKAYSKEIGEYKEEE